MLPGRYILQPEVMALLATQEAGAGGEVQLTDSMAKLIGTQPFHGVTFAGERFDCGSKLGFAQANFALACRDAAMGDDLKVWARTIL
jgi:UTP--glucose-1-phosphate uridylyltransferase